MVRFSDMLGGDGDSDEARAKTAPRDLPPPVVDDPPDPDAVEATGADAPAPVEANPVGSSPVASTEAESAQAVLDRLTQYATASRAAEPPVPERAPETDGAAPSTADAAPGAGDDILPRGKRSLRNPRGSKRAK